MKQTRLILVCPQCREESHGLPWLNGDILWPFLLANLDNLAVLPWPLPLTFVCEACGTHAPVRDWPRTLGTTEEPAE